MCGLLGMMGRGMTVNHRVALRELLFLSSLRGEDSTGFLGVNTRSSREYTRLIKEVFDPIRYIYRHGSKGDILSSPEFDILMGHNRWATVGKVNKDNVHPFDVGPMVGAHNGTLTSEPFYDPKMTDSEMMFRRMVKKGIVPTLEEADCWDAWAVSIYQKESGKMILATNGQRPLAVAICEHSDVMYWASEYMMLHCALARNHISAKVYQLSPFRLYSIDINEVKAKNSTPWTTHEITRPPVQTKVVSVSGYSAEDSARVFTQGLNDPIPF